VSSRGASGGIRIFWKMENFELQAQMQTQFWLRVNLLNKASGMLFSIINVYIPNNYNEKIECWQSLIDLAKENPPPPEPHYCRRLQHNQSRNGKKRRIGG
jgi:hypothetical protein